MGKPENTEEFEAFTVNDITFFIAKDVLESDLKEKSINFCIEGYGKYRLEFLE